MVASKRGVADARYWTEPASRAAGRGRGRAKLWRFVLLHLTSLGVLFVPFNAAAAVVFVASTALRLLAITVGYHRYFAHRSFDLGRGAQFVLAVCGTTCGQRGPLWWAAQHRRHHQHSDLPADHHSPRQLGFWQAHMGWVFDQRTTATDFSAVQDLAVFPELRWLNRNHFLPLAAFAAALYATGEALGRWVPGIGASGPQFLCWGFFASTLALAHITLAVNSFGHRFGGRAFETGDDSRNSFWLALLTGGEGWHNNHHRFPRSARHGLKPHEVDVSYLVIRALAGLGIARRVRLPAPADVARARAEIKRTGGALDPTVEVSAARP